MIYEKYSPLCSVMFGDTAQCIVVLAPSDDFLPNTWKRQATIFGLEPPSLFLVILVSTVPGWSEKTLTPVPKHFYQLNWIKIRPKNVTFCTFQSVG
jgi:hypothetical protein